MSPRCSRNVSAELAALVQTAADFVPVPRQRRTGYLMAYYAAVGDGMRSLTAPPERMTRSQRVSL